MTKCDIADIECDGSMFCEECPVMMGKFEEEEMENILIKINVNLDFRGMPKDLVEEWKAMLERLEKNPNVKVEETE